MPAHIAELLRMRDSLTKLTSTHDELSAADDAPFVIYLTERMLRDIEECRKQCLKLQRRAAWPSLN